MSTPIPLRPEDSAKLRAYLEDKGLPVKFREPNSYEARHPEWYPRRELVSTYGWTDYDAAHHALGGYRAKHQEGQPCPWVVPKGAVLYEQTYSLFQDTLSDNKEEVGVNVEGCHCSCGKYTDVTLRVVATFTEIMRVLLGVPKNMEYQL